jgi:hypothetical protein
MFVGGMAQVCIAAKLQNSRVRVTLRLVLRLGAKTLETHDQ